MKPNSNLPFEAGFACEDITPRRGIPLAGYFNPRPNTGARDPLRIKAALFRSGTQICGIVSYDLVALSADQVAGFRRALRRRGFAAANRRLMFAATHTHTGPYACPIHGAPVNRAYLQKLVRKTVRAVLRAQAAMQPCTIAYGQTMDNPFAYNRRYFMNNGRVVTNPGKKNPRIVKPEGPVDREISVVVFRHGRRLVGILVNLVNHTDTIGDDKVSADWPGEMERRLQTSLASRAPVLTLVGCSGNINHFDVTSRRNQTQYAEAQRIGAGYARIVLRLIKHLKTWPGGKVDSRRLRIAIPSRRVRRQELKHACSLLRQAQSTGNEAHNLTSEDLAQGHPVVDRFFAEQLLVFHRQNAGRSYPYDLTHIGFGRAIGILSLPGEPFTEIGLALKKKSPYAVTLIASLANGECGYIPMKACFHRGGYEILPVPGAGARADTAERLIRAGRHLLSHPC